LRRSITAPLASDNRGARVRRRPAGPPQHAEIGRIYEILSKIGRMSAWIKRKQLL